ncbi:hypothetical protein G4B88_001901 [Cannabis sativa]|uniref:TF-B3 domain-containing protein n=1 Tax=Cannabis sativa TaxID=3483 RepID=A0A7J6HCU0_CANSA|nr:hypothetical protein G4B88_001901 [Cannabis sativa]
MAFSDSHIAQQVEKHFPRTAHHIFNIMIEQTPPNTKLQISKAFWVKYCESLSNQVFPKLPCRSTEEVELTKNSDGKRPSSEAATKFFTDNPYFQVKLRAHQLRGNGNLYIPVAIANSWFEKKAQIVSLWVGEKYWHAAFARDNSLQKTDVCIFELINKNQAKIKVTIFRQSESSMAQQ